MKISIVTPTYNRKNIIKESIDSSLSLIENNYADELIIIDDASTDGTSEFLQNAYKNEIKTGIMILKILKDNIGVTGAKNKGAELSSGEWIVFMDSDDYFLENIGSLFHTEILSNKDYDLLFFRCIDNNTKKLIGPKKEAYALNFLELMNNGTPGECLPAIKRDAILKNPYPTDLRGCESLSYYDMLNNSSKAFVSDLIVRGYDASGDDRLSLKKSIIKRADKLIKYNYRTLKYWKIMSPQTLTGKITRIIYYIYLKALH
jgi:glycosyltransferase involved in cell wall biosynthesis